MGATSEQVRWEIFPVQDTLNERGVILWVDEKYFDETTTLVQYTTLSDFMSDKDIPKGDAITRGFGSYIYTEQLPKTNGCLRFIFLKAKTEQQKWEVVKPVYPINEVTWWPNWLLSLYALKATIALQSEVGNLGASVSANDVTGVRYLDRYILIPGGNFNTQHYVETYFSPTPLVGMVATEPRPTTIVYSALGLSNSIDCLHDEVKIPEIYVSAERVEDFGTPNAREVRWEMGSIFPATNMTGWVPHHRKLDVFERDGGFYYRRHLVIPPNPFKPLEI